MDINWGPEYRIQCWVCLESKPHWETEEIRVWWQKLFVMMAEVEEGRKNASELRIEYEKSLETTGSLIVCSTHLPDVAKVLMRLLNIQHIDDEPEFEAVERTYSRAHLIDRKMMKKDLLVDNSIQFVATYWHDIVDSSSSNRPTDSPPPRRRADNLNAERGNHREVNEERNDVVEVEAEEDREQIRVVEQKDQRRVAAPRSTEESTIVEIKPHIKIEPCTPESDVVVPKKKTRFDEDVILVEPPVGPFDKRYVRVCAVCKHKSNTTEICSITTKLLILFAAGKRAVIPMAEAKEMFLRLKKRNDKSVAENRRDESMFTCEKHTKETAETIFAMLKIDDPKNFDKAKQSDMQKYLGELRAFMGNALIPLEPAFLKRLQRVACRYWTSTGRAVRGRRRSRSAHHSPTRNSQPSVVRTRSLSSVPPPRSKTPVKTPIVEVETRKRHRSRRRSESTDRSDRILRSRAPRHSIAVIPSRTSSSTTPKTPHRPESATPSKKKHRSRSRADSGTIEQSRDSHAHRRAELITPKRSSISSNTSSCRADFVAPPRRPSLSPDRRSGNPPSTSSSQPSTSTTRRTSILMSPASSSSSGRKSRIDMCNRTPDMSQWRTCLFCGLRKESVKSIQIEEVKRVMIVLFLHTGRMEAVRAKYLFINHQRFYVCDEHRREIAIALINHFGVENPEHIQSKGKDQLGLLMRHVRKFDCKPIDPDQFLAACQNFAVTYWQAS